MGIRHLQTFMERFVPNGYEEVSIIEECLMFQRNNIDQKPTLVIDLMGVASILNVNKIDLLYGGRHEEYSKVLDDLFRRMSEVANLVFFEDGPVMADKYDTWIKRQDDKYDRCIEVIDRVYCGDSIEEIAKSSHVIPSVTTHLELIELKAKEYGELIVTFTRECDAELAKYANSKKSVVAVMADDSDFLIFQGTWKYFSLLQINLKTLTTREFNRTALRKFLNLNDKQLMVFATLGGNDIIKYDQIRRVHQYSFGGHNAAQKFPAIAQYIRDEVEMNNFNTMIGQLANFLLGDSRPYKMDQIFNSISQYNLFEAVDYSQTSPLLDYCIANSYTFVFEILEGMPKNLTTIYYDMRRNDWPYYLKTVLKPFCRNIGIILQHKQSEEDIEYEIYGKRSINEGHHQMFVKPIYPSIEVPPLLELLNHSSYPQLDKVRIQLMKWAISDNLKDIDLSNIPRIYFCTVLTLFFVVQEKFISINEADIILLSIKQVELDMLPENLHYPPVVDERAFRISFLFCKMYSTIGRSIKLTGMNHLKKNLNFDGVFFHKIYLDFQKSLNDPSLLLSDIDHCRIYKFLK